MSHYILHIFLIIFMNLFTEFCTHLSTLFISGRDEFSRVFLQKLSPSSCSVICDRDLINGQDCKHCAKTGDA